jgi:hypothetical protein
MQKVLWRCASLSIGAPLGNLKGNSFTRDFERWIKDALDVERLSLTELCKGNLERGGSLTGDPGGCVKALETGISLHRDPAEEPRRGFVYRGR